MTTFKELAAQLASIETVHRELLAEHFELSNDLIDCVTGGLRFAVIDRHHATIRDPLPVVCAIGINYTQQAIGWQGRLYEFEKLVTNTGTRSKAALLIAAAHRNRDEWIDGEVVDRKRPCLAGLASHSRPLVRGPNLSDVEPFIFVMTNVVPFVTNKKWQDQAKATRSACSVLLARYSANAYLDDLFKTIGSKVDLWIGHSAIYGTQWVWPSFDAFKRRHTNRNWIFGPNLNPQAHLYLNGDFRKSDHRLSLYFA